jgi:protein O-GlcNAc transferase
MNNHPHEPPANDVSAAFALYQGGKRREAEAAYRQILRREPDNADALHLLGQLAHECGHHRDAEMLMRRAIELMPGAADFHNNLGAMLTRTARTALAIPLLRRAIALKADYPEAYNNLGAALEAQGDGDAAAEAYQRAVELRPGYSGAYGNLSAALEWLGRPQAATEARLRRIEAAPSDPQAHSDLLTGMLYHAGDDAEGVLAESLRWAERHERPWLGKKRPHGDGRMPGTPVESRHSGHGPASEEPGDSQDLGGERAIAGAPSLTPLTLPRSTGGGNQATNILSEHARRVLRVGYVSGDLRAHPVARFFAPMLACHDRGQFAITCYSHVARGDATTEQLKKRADAWRDIAALSDDAAAELIRRDQIDILVDLCGHMPFNRLPLFARKAAPVQVTYLGYPSTTGMSSMDWRITDARHDPPGETERFHTERLARIEGGCWCYQGDDEGPAVNDLPALSGQPFTFVMFNRLVKVTPAIVRLWSRTLSATPNSRLMFLATERGDLQDSTLEMFVREGFPMDRLVSVGRRPRHQYMQLFHRADLALDTFPYAGHTTTCDALWMGVPTVTLAGRTHVARAGLAVMESLDLGEFVARCDDEYVAIATRWAGNLAQLREVRCGLRRQMASSPLCDPERLTRGIESAYREMWVRWRREG